MAVKLNWVDADSGNELGPGVVLEGKFVILRDKWTPEKEPDELTLYEIEGWLAWTLRTIKGKPAPTSTMSAVQKPPGSGISEVRWKTQVGTLKTMQTIWRFWDKANNIRSGPLVVTGSHAGALVTADIGRPIPIDFGVGHLGTTGHLKTEIPVFGKERTHVATYVNATDPKVTCRLLGTWDPGPNGLVDFLVKREPGISRDLLESQFLREFGPKVFEHPESLDVRVDEPSFEIPAGGSSDVYITISAGSTSEDHAYFVVAATIDGDPNQTVISELIEVAVAAAPQPVAVGV